MADVQSRGRAPLDSDNENRLLRGSASHSAPSFRSLPGTLSGPLDLEGSVLPSRLKTSSQVTLISVSSSWLLEFASSSFSIDNVASFSCTNTDEKNLQKALAFWMGRVSDFP